MQVPLSSVGKSTGLRSNSLAFPEVLAQSIALISPTMTAVLIIPYAFSFAGPGTWLSYLFGTIMLLFVVFNLNQFARRSTAPGSMYAYIGRGLGARWGVLSGWTLLWCYLFIGTAGMNGFAIFSDQLLTALGFGGHIPPFVFFLISGAICWYLAYKDIRLSSMLMLVLEGLSVLLILGLAAIVLFGHGFSADTSQFTLKGVTLPGMSLGVVASIFSLVGFESATALGGETKNPLRNIPRAVIWSLILTGLFFVVMSYVEVSGVRGYKMTLDQIAAPLNVLSELYNVSFLKIPLSIGAMISFFSLSLSCLNAGARIIFPMARHTVFPAPLGKAHKTNQTPAMAITVYIAIMVLIPIGLSLVTDTLTAFNDAGTLAAFGFLLAYFLVSIAAPAYLKRTGELRPFRIVLSILAIVCLLVPTVGSFYPVPAYPVNIFPYIFLGYMLIGAVWLFMVSRRSVGIMEEIEQDMEASLQHHSRPTEEELVVVGKLEGAVGD
ncbi:MAG TPA: APC family permease [Ktedonosporobacter sp.]|nr:APC family permease [Ktedonosporobacter sp.]